MALDCPEGTLRVRPKVVIVPAPRVALGLRGEGGAGMQHLHLFAFTHFLLIFKREYFFPFKMDISSYIPKELQELTTEYTHLTFRVSNEGLLIVSDDNKIQSSPASPGLWTITMAPFTPGFYRDFTAVILSKDGIPAPDSISFREADMPRTYGHNELWFATNNLTLCSGNRVLSFSLQFLNSTAEIYYHMFGNTNMLIIPVRLNNNVSYSAKLAIDSYIREETQRELKSILPNYDFTKTGISFKVSSNYELQRLIENPPWKAPIRILINEDGTINIKKGNKIIDNMDPNRGTYLFRRLYQNTIPAYITDVRSAKHKVLPTHEGRDVYDRIMSIVPSINIHEDKISIFRTPTGLDYRIISRNYRGD